MTEHDTITLIAKLGPRAIAAILSGEAAVVPLDLTFDHLTETGAIDGYDVDLGSGDGDTDHLDWWALAVKCSRLDLGDKL